MDAHCSRGDLRSARGVSRDGDVDWRTKVGVSTSLSGKEAVEARRPGSGMCMRCQKGVMRNKINKDENENEEGYTYRYGIGESSGS
jgi:hypothetical protein